jgi:hypothetical protein
MDSVVAKFIYTPMVAVIGIYIVGTLLQNLIGIPMAVTALFSAVGGIVYIANFYK